MNKQQTGHTLVYDCGPISALSLQDGDDVYRRLNDIIVTPFI